MTKEIDVDELKRLQTLHPETIRVDEVNRVVTLIGWSFSEKIPNAHGDKGEGEEVENDAHALGAPRVSRNGSSNPTQTIVSEHLLVGVINPLTKTPEEDTKRDKGCRTSRIGRKNAGTVQKKHKSTSDNQDLVPVIKFKFRQWIIHFMRRLLGSKNPF